ncbi:MAG: PKD domain-containing protein, partial [Flavobacteriales bacterium]|nr:PKD domain-containing protein [Flavobacteriales bacterium]
MLLVGIREVALAQCDADAGPNITVCEGEQFTLGGSPAGTGDNPIDYEWDASSGPDPADVANPTMTLNNAGTYVYTLEIEDDDGCDDDDQVTVTVLNGPNAGFNFGPDDECAGTPVNFVNTTTSCSGCTYEWDFDNPASGSSNTSTLQNPTHIFVASGSGTVSFDVTLTVTASNGCTDTQVVEVDVLQSPTAVLNEDVNFTQCLGFNDFYAYVTDNSTPGTNANYNIDWGDGSPDYNSATAPNALEHIYTGVDIWDLTYTVTGLNGCTDSESYVVTNITNPAIGVGTSGNTLQCGPVEMCFDLTNWSNNHPSTVYIVDFGDGTAPVTYSHPPPASVCHDYATSSCPGSFTFEITADNNCPISSEATITPIQIYTPPIAQFTNPANWCAGSAAPFTNTSIPGYNLSCSSNATYSWNFGDPASGAANTSTDVSPTHTYALPGTYTVTMTATNGGNPLLACGTTTFTGTI